MPVSPLSTQNFHTSGQRRQVDELIEIMSPTTVPFLKLVGIDGEPGRNPKYEWIEDNLLAETTRVQDNPLTAGATTLNVPPGEGVNLQAGMLIKIENEYLYITAVSGDAASVIRGVAGTTPASHNQNTVVEVVGLANAENAPAPTKGTTELVFPYNYFQDFDTAYQISYKAANTDVYGVPEGDDARELEKAFKEVVIKLERACFLGRRAAPSGGVPALMGGLTYFLSTDYSTNHTEIDLGGRDVTEADINDMLQSIFYKVGEDNMAKTILCGVWNKRLINDIYAPSHRATRNERVGGVIVNTIDTDYGPIDVVHSLRCPKDKIFFLNLDFIKVHPYQGLAFFDQELSRDGAYIKRQIYGSYTMVVKNTKAMGVIKNTSTQAS